MGGACSTYEGEEYIGLWWGNLKEREDLEDPSVNGSITLQWIFKTWGVEAWTGLIWIRIGTCGVHFCGIEPTDSLTMGEFLTS